MMGAGIEEQTTRNTSGTQRWTKHRDGGTEMAMEPYRIPTESTQKPYTGKQNHIPHTNT